MIANKIGTNCLILILFLAIAGCDSFVTKVTPTSQITLEAPLIDHSIFTDSPCKAPCWYNLNLGKSTEADVLATLNNLSFVNKNTIQESAAGYWDTSRRRNIQATLIAAGCKSPVGQQCVGLIIAKGILSNIVILPNYDIAFQEIVNRLGVPDYVRVNLIPPAGNECSLLLIWMSRQIIVEHDNFSQKNPCVGIDSNKAVDSSLTIQSIYYLLPQDIVLTTIPAPSTDYPWVGFMKP